MISAQISFSWRIYISILFQVEHFFREEKSKEAYELIEIFCELIVARMPMIESQKYDNLFSLKGYLFIYYFKNFFVGFSLTFAYRIYFDYRVCICIRFHMSSDFF